MKKRLIVVLAVLATVVGLAFAAGRSLTHYSKCGHDYYKGSKVTSSQRGDTIGNTIDDNCPECKAAYCRILEDTANSGNESAKSLWYDSCK